MNTNKELFRNILIFGLILAGAVMLLDLLIYTFDLSGTRIVFGIIIFLIWMTIYISFFIWGGRKYRNKYFNGYIDYGKAFVFCFLMAVVSTLAIALYYYLFYNFFDPERAANEAQRWVEMISGNDNIPEEKKEEIIQDMLEKAKPNQIVLRNLINNAVFSIIIGSISALFVRKKRKNQRYRLLTD